MRRACGLRTAAVSGLLALTAAGAWAKDAGGPASETWLLESEAGASPAEEAPGALPDTHWHTLFTAHFRIHFYDEERALADRAAVIAERAHKRLTTYLNWLPSGRVDITLSDETDVANGFASSLPENFLHGYGAPPGSLDELNDFDDFLNLLITHELTHVVHLDTIMGPARLLDFLEGKVYAPNLAQPNWFIEGLAVLMESRQTSAGRVRSSFFDMQLRVPYLEGRLLSLAAVSNGPLIYPQGTAAYIYGSNLLAYIEDRYGADKIQEISHRYGSTLIPGGVNRISRQAVGQGYDGIWQAWRSWIARRYSLQVEEATRRGLTPVTRLTHDGQGSSEGLFPRYFRDGRGVVYQKATNVDHPAYMLLDPNTGRRRELMEVYDAGPAAPAPDGQALIFERTNFRPLRRRISGSAYVSWNDLFRLDLRTGEIRELTRAWRAHDPDVSPDGTRIACTVGSTGRRDLALVPIAGGAPTVLARDVPGLAYGPSWSPDGRQIAYSRWKPGGFRDIHIFDLASGQDRALWVDRALDVDPRFSPDGRFVVFSSDRTGIYNIFAYELGSGRLYQVTNILGGAFQPAVAPDESRVVFTGFTSDGFDLFSAPFEPARWPLAEPYVNARPDPVNGTAPVPQSSTPAESAPVVEEIAEYQPWRYMYPRTWQLTFSSNPLGIGASVGIQTMLGDPVGNHSLSLNALIPGDGDASLAASYSYNGLWPSLQLFVSRTALAAGDLIMDGQNRFYRQNSFTASGGTSLPVLQTTESSANLSFSYEYDEFAPAGRLPVADPTAGITVAPETGPNASLNVALSYANVHSWGYSISGQDGRSLQLSLQLSDPSLGGKYHTTEVSWFWTEYFTPPWAKLHALALLYSGGAGIGDRRSFFGLGGFTDQDVVRSLFLRRQQCCFFLRGYEAGSLVGDQFQLLSAEYRLPLLVLENGYQTFPLYLRRVSGAVFGDAGNAFQGQFHPSELKYGVGAQLRFEMKLVYYLETQFQIGFAKGLSSGGGNQYYFVTAIPIF